MVEDVRAHLSNSRTNFESNVRDNFGQSICQDVYEPFDEALATLSKAVDEAHDEQQVIENLLCTLRTII